MGAESKQSDGRYAQLVEIASGGSGGGGAATVADGADVAEGSTTDAAVTAGAAGTVNAHLRSISRDLVANVGSTTLATAAKQPALGTAGTASTDVITVQGIASGTALAVSSTTLATAAKQPALGTAGTASTDVITVQGIASGVAQAVSVADGSNAVDGSTTDAAATAGGTGTLSAKMRLFTSTIVAEDAAAVGGSNGLAVFGARQDSRASSVSADGDNHAFIFDAASRLKVWRSGASTDWSVAGTLTNGTASTIKTAGGSGVRNRICAVQVSHTALGAATVLALRDGSGGSVLWQVALDTTLLQGEGFLLDPPVCGSANTLVEAILLTNPTSGTVYANVQGDVISN